MRSRETRAGQKWRRESTARPRAPAVGSGRLGRRSQGTTGKFPGSIPRFKATRKSDGLTSWASQSRLAGREHSWRNTSPIVEVTLFELFVVILLFALLAWGYRWQRTRGWIPRELRDAELAYAEKLFKARRRGSVVLVAKVDRAYRRRDGIIVLMDLKTRRRLRSYPSDVIELSAQRLALMGQTGERVEMYAYAVAQDFSGRRFAHRVDLLDEAAVDGLIERREAILNGDLQPKQASSSVLCRGCAYFATACHPDRKHRA